MVDIEALKICALATKGPFKSGFEYECAYHEFEDTVGPEGVLELIGLVESAQARCAELQSHQDDYDRVHAGIEAAELDAARYRWLRAVDNHYGRSLLATCAPDKLDKAIDAEISKVKP